MEKQLVKNSFKCGRCGGVITSEHTHDYVTCSCGACFVDGGLSYVRRGGAGFNEMEDLCVYVDKGDYREAAKHLTWGTYGKEGKGPFVRKVITDLDTDHIEAILCTQTHINGSFIEKVLQHELTRREQNDIPS